MIFYNKNLTLTVKFTLSTFIVNKKRAKIDICNGYNYILKVKFSI